MKKKTKTIKVLDAIISIIIYSIILITVSLIFDDTVYIDNAYYGVYSLLASFIIYILNRTVKPILVWITIPITAITFGLFYPMINVFILKITDWILFSHFEIKGIIIPFFVAIIISITHIIMEHFVNKILEAK